MTDRHTRILELHAEGRSTMEIAAAVGVSRQRVWQVLHREDTLTLIESLVDDTLDG